MKTCLNCNNSFESKKSFAKFCSDKCRVYHNRKHPEKKNIVSNAEIRFLYNEMIAMMQKFGSEKIPITPANIYENSENKGKIEKEPFLSNNDTVVKNMNWFLKNAPNSTDSQEDFLSFRAEIQKSPFLTGKERKELLLAFDTGNLITY